jgi:hypothetical protein
MSPEEHLGIQPQSGSFAIHQESFQDKFGGIV